MVSNIFDSCPGRWCNLLCAYFSDGWKPPARVACGAFFVRINWISVVGHHSMPRRTAMPAMWCWRCWPLECLEFWFMQPKNERNPATWKKTALWKRKVIFHPPSFLRLRLVNLFGRSLLERLRNYLGSDSFNVFSPRKKGGKWNRKSGGGYLGQKLVWRRFFVQQKSKVVRVEFTTCDLTSVLTDGRNIAAAPCGENFL